MTIDDGTPALVVDIVDEEPTSAALAGILSTLVDAGHDREAVAGAALLNGLALMQAARGPLRRHEVARVLRQLAFVVEEGEPIAGRA